MIRVVARSKAIVAGVAGALAMQLTSYALQLAGIPSVDLVAQLGSVVLPGGTPAGVAVGVLAHAGVGAGWALFYAYFFWGRFRWPPPLQGLENVDQVKHAVLETDSGISVVPRKP